MPSGPELYIVIAVVVLLFGGAKLPQLARSLGQAKKEFEKGKDETPTDTGTPGTSASNDTPSA